MNDFDLPGVLTRLHEDTASPEDVGGLEMHLHDVLMAEGAEGVEALLLGVEAPRLQIEPHDDPHFTVFVSAPATPRIHIGVYAAEDMTMISAIHQDMTLEEMASAGASAGADPGHKAFYGAWGAMTGLEDDGVAGLDPALRAVYLVASFEAQVMNGGLGQYLANTDGRFADDTISMLREIGATESAGLLEAAVELSEGAESFDAAWDDRSEELSALDDRFHGAAEDLAGLTVARFPLG